MNRRERRARVRFGHGDPLAALKCPDCDSELTVVEVAPRVLSAEVRHDDTCPWFSELKRDLS